MSRFYFRGHRFGMAKSSGFKSVDVPVHAEKSVPAPISPCRVLEGWIHQVREASKNRRDQGSLI